MAARIILVILILLGIGGGIYMLTQKDSATVVVTPDVSEQTTDALKGDGDVVSDAPPQPAPADGSSATTDGASLENLDGATVDSTVGTDEAAAEAADAATADETVTETTTATDGATTTDAASGAAATDAMSGAAATETTSPEAAAPAATEAAPAAEEGTEATEQGTDESGSLLQAPASLTFDVATLMQDRVEGNVSAPVTIVEYASMTCPHCARFSNEVHPGVKASLIDTGKAKLIFREFPLDKFALKASMLARCAPADKYYDFIQVVFRNQDRWVKAEDPLAALKQLGTLTGMDNQYMDACMNNTELETAILNRQAEAQKQFNISSTPTFVFNNGAETLTGSATVETFEQTVNKLSGK